MFMKNWHDDSVTISDECLARRQQRCHDRGATSGHTFQAIDLSVEYKERIVDYMFAEYEAGKDAQS